jgi:hypothetical protein
MARCRTSISHTDGKAHYACEEYKDALFDVRPIPPNSGELVFKRPGAKEMAAENWSGWVKMENSRKWHYFASGDNDMTSLCGKFMMLRKPAIIEEGNDDSPDNCSACRRKLRFYRKV